MSLIKSLIYCLLTLSIRIKYWFYRPSLLEHKISDVPYFSQFASEEMVESFIEGKVNVKDDPKWRESGAKTINEYVKWSWNSCGMSCLQMILYKKLGKKIPLVQLSKKCLQYKGYVINKKAERENDYKHYYDGLYYHPFLTFIKDQYNVTGRIAEPLIIQEIIQAVEKNHYVIASVNPGIRNPLKKPGSKSGHLILITGYNMRKNSLYIHNPSGYYNKSQKYAEISFSDFSRFFSGKGMIIE